MMFVLNDLTPFHVITVGNPTQYRWSKNGGTLTVGTGTVAIQSTAGLVITRITPAAGETDTLGRLEFQIMDVGGNTLDGHTFDVVRALPGDTVTQLLGDVAGNLVGNVLGSLSVAERIAISNTSFDLPDAVEPGLIFRDALKAMFAALSGRTARNGHDVLFRNFGNTKTRITATVAPDGTRPNVLNDFS